jgi:hypothetical protein
MFKQMLPFTVVTFILLSLIIFLSTASGWTPDGSRALVMTPDSGNYRVYIGIEDFDVYNGLRRRAGRNKQVPCELYELRFDFLKVALPL